MTISAGGSAQEILAGNAAQAISAGGAAQVISVVGAAREIPAGGSAEPIPAGAAVSSDTEEEDRAEIPEGGPQAGTLAIQEGASKEAEEEDVAEVCTYPYLGLHTIVFLLQGFCA